MFPDRYFAARYFPNRYWPIGAGVVPPVPPVAARGGGGNMLMHRETPIIRHDNRQRAAILEALEDEW